MEAIAAHLVEGVDCCGAASGGDFAEDLGDVIIDDELPYPILLILIHWRGNDDKHASRRHFILVLLAEVGIILFELGFIPVCFGGVVVAEEHHCPLDVREEEGSVVLLGVPEGVGRGCGDGTVGWLAEVFDFPVGGGDGLELSL